MIDKLIFRVYAQPLHRVVILMACAVIVWAWAAAVLWSRKKQNLVRVSSLVLFLLFFAGIFYATMHRSPVDYSALVLRPFQVWIDARIQPELYRSMLMNVLLFFPFGLFLPFVLAEEKGFAGGPEGVSPRGRRNPVISALALGILCSLIVEALQYSFSLGRAETDDVIMNTIGTAAGCLSYVLARFLYERGWGGTAER